jgi:hypothetical protein
MVDQPKKVSGYKVEWLRETYYCSKRSEVGEWLQGLLEADIVAEGSCESARTVIPSR